MKKKQIAITLGIMCLLLTFGIGIQLKTTKNLVSTAGSTYRENGLRDEVLKWKEQYDSKYEELEKIEADLEKERKVSISSEDSSVEKQEELKKLNKNFVDRREFSVKSYEEVLYSWNRK